MPSPPPSKPSLFSGTPDIPRSLCTSNHVFPLSMTLSHSTWTRALSSSKTRPQPSFLYLLCWEQVQTVATTASYGWFWEWGISCLVPSLTFTPDISAVGGVLLPSPPGSQAPHLTPHVPHLGPPPPAPLSLFRVSLLSMPLTYPHCLSLTPWGVPLILGIICLKSPWGLF